MKKRYPFMAATVMAAALTLGTAPAANAEWGDPGTPGYCSPSTGCYTDPNTGAPVRIDSTTPLTATEEQWRAQCYNAAVGLGLSGAAAILSKNGVAGVAVVFTGISVIAGPCTSFWDSTARFRS